MLRDLKARIMNYLRERMQRLGYIHKETMQIRGLLQTPLAEIVNVLVHDGRHALARLRNEAESLTYESRANPKHERRARSIDHSVKELAFIFANLQDIFIDQQFPTRFSAYLVSPILEHLKRRGRRRISVLTTPSLRSAPSVMAQHGLAKAALLYLLNYLDGSAIRIDAVVQGSVCNFQFHLVSNETPSNLVSLVRSKGYTELLLGAGFILLHSGPNEWTWSGVIAKEGASDPLHR